MTYMDVTIRVQDPDRLISVAVPTIAAYPDGSGLPTHLDGRTLSGFDVRVPVEWTNAATANFPVYGSTTLNYSATLGEVTLIGSAQVDVVPVGTVVAIDAGNMGDSLWFNAVNNLLDRAPSDAAARLLNDAPDKNFGSPGVPWGAQDGTGANAIGIGRTANPNDRWLSRIWGNNNITGRHMFYRLPELPPGTYNVKVGVFNPWAARVTQIARSIDNGATFQTGGGWGNMPSSASNQNVMKPAGTATYNFTITNPTSVWLRFQSTIAQAPVISWIVVSQAGAEIIDPQDTLSFAGDPIVEAAFANETLADALPATVLVSGRLDGQNFERADATVVWDDIDLSARLYETITVSGVASYGGMAVPVSARVEVIAPNTVYFINSGTYGQYAGGATAVGSDIFDAVRRRVGADLINVVPDRPYTTGGWGWRNGSANTFQHEDGTLVTSVPSTGVNARGLPPAFSADKFNHGLFAANNVAQVSFDYVLPLTAGTYDIAIGLAEWWVNVNRATIIIAQFNDGEDRTVWLNGPGGTVVNMTNPPGPQAIVEGTLTLEANSIVTLSFIGSQTLSESPVCAWIQISRAEEETTPEALSASVSDGVVTATYNNLTDSAQTVGLIIAVYGSDGALMAVRQLPPAAVAASGSVNVTLDASGLDLTGATFSAFAWDAAFMPLTGFVSGDF